MTASESLATWSELEYRDGPRKQLLHVTESQFRVTVLAWNDSRRMVTVPVTRAQGRRHCLRLAAGRGGAAVSRALWFPSPGTGKASLESSLAAHGYYLKLLRARDW